jgi:AraC-like DNA-binding protein
MDGLIRSLIKCIRRRARTHEKLTVEEVSRELGYTRQHVSACFRDETGRLLSDFLRQRRLHKAARLLKTGKLTVTEISHLCGFDSENYFRQQFRTFFGMPPRQFRLNGSLRQRPTVQRQRA